MPRRHGSVRGKRLEVTPCAGQLRFGLNRRHAAQRKQLTNGDAQLRDRKHTPGSDLRQVSRGQWTICARGIPSLVGEGIECGPRKLPRGTGRGKRRLHPWITEQQRPCTVKLLHVSEGCEQIYGVASDTH